MFARRLFASSAVLGLLLALAACDFSGDDGLTGRWVGDAEFSVDTLLADQNVRFIADYETEFTFDITDDEGLITGVITARTVGRRIYQEAGQPADTLVYDERAPFSHEFFGTYIDPVLEVDVPTGPYEANLWTFDVTGRGADLNRFIVHYHTLVLSDLSTFEFAPDSDDLFEMNRVGEIVTEGSEDDGE